MNKKVLILSGSPRKGGNSDVLCDEFMRGAQDAGNEVEKIFIADKNISFCRACYACKKRGGGCVIDDDMPAIIKKMQDADVIVMSSPVYFYSIDAQMKAVIDRCFSRWINIPNKDFYFIMTSGSTKETAMVTTLACFRGYISCLENASEKGVIYGKGLHDAGDVRGTDYMAQAFEMGRNA